MAYNKTSEERKWNYWKEQEEKKLRELGMAVSYTHLTLMRSSAASDVYKRQVCKGCKGASGSHR